MDHAEASVSRALSVAPEVRLVLLARSTPANVVVSYEAPGVPTGAVLDVAVVERLVTSEVRAGENSGKTLRHANVVRAFVTTPLASTAGTVTLRVPPTLRREDADVIAYVQRAPGDATGMAVLGAASTHIDGHE